MARVVTPSSAPLTRVRFATDKANAGGGVYTVLRVVLLFASSINGSVTMPTFVDDNAVLTMNPVDAQLILTRRQISRKRGGGGHGARSRAKPCIIFLSV
jgi:hypothetical protein